VSWLPAPTPTGTCLVTGASSGIGAAIAHQLAGRGYGLDLVARREEKLRGLAAELGTSGSPRVAVMPCDLADPAARRELVAGVEAAGRRVDLLINSAGLGTYGPFVELDRERELEQVRVMSEAIVDLCGAFAPTMADERSGAILIVSSSLGFGPVPRYATYSATKAFDIAFGASLHAELRSSGVAVSTVCPGPVETEFFKVNGPQPPQRVIPRAIWQQPETVARAALDGLERNKRVVIPGRPMRIAMTLSSLAPQALRLRTMDRFFRAPGERR
jgi:short-subunit dehydrogenase